MRRQGDKFVLRYYFLSIKPDVNILKTVLFIFSFDVWDKFWVLIRPVPADSLLI